MSFFNKDYVFVKQERFDEFLKSVGVPDSQLDGALKFAPGQKVVQDGDGYIFYTTDFDGPKVVKFKSGVEFDDTIGVDKAPTKETITIEGNVATHVVKGAQGTVTFKREYSGDDLVVTITSDKWDGVAKRYYKAA